MAYARRHRAAALATVVWAAVTWTLFLAACGSGSGPKTSSSASAVLVKPASAITVVIKNFAFLPANFTVPPGAAVTVRNEDQVIHTLTANNMAFNTGNLAHDLPVTFQAPMQPGEYPYHCFLHHYMTGVLTVAD